MTQYCDYTSFEPSKDQWNKWVKGANGQTLDFAQDNGNYYVYFNLKGNLQGTILEKELTKLPANEKYRISIRVRRINDQDKYPSITWRLGGVELGDPTPIYDREWHVIRTDFVAKDGPQKLTLHGTDSAGHGKSADFWFDDIRIYPVEMQEDFEDNLGGVVKPGETLDQGALIITLPPTSTNDVGIQKHTLSVDGKLEGQGLALNRNVAANLPEQEVTIQLKGEYSNVEFSWTWISQRGEVRFYGPGQRLLGQSEVLPINGAHQNVSFKAEQGDYVTEMVITARDFSYLDFFRFR